MNSRQLSWALLLLNIGLLAVVIYLAGRRGGAVALDEIGEGESRVVTNTVTQIAVRKVNATNLLAALASRSFNWRMLESTNYFAYVQNLRNFGCPEETVRDILITDVAKAYAARRAELRARAPAPRYWETVADGRGGAPAEPAELREQLAALDREQEQLIRDLLGVDVWTELARYTDDGEGAGPVLAFLPEAKRDGVRMVQAKYDEAEAAIRRAAGGLLLESDREALGRLSREREAELAKVLTPEELLAYQLHHSDTAASLRVQLNGFGPTQEEFTRIFELQKAFDDQFGHPTNVSDERAMAARAVAETRAQEALETELRKVLGPLRYEEYQRSQDGDYRAVSQLAERFQLGPDVANSVYNLKVTAERQKRAVESNPNLGDVERAQRLAALAQQTERSVAAVLGGSVYQDYERGPGQWLNNLYFFDEENLPPDPTAAEATSRTPLLPPLPIGILNSLPPGYRELLLNTPGALPPQPPQAPPPGR